MSYSKHSKKSRMFLTPAPYKENELILNTPKRLEILNEGLTVNQSTTNLLGRGTYGTVIKAIYKAQPVAVKVIKNLQAVNEEATIGEINVLGWLHPNIVKIFKIESTTNFSIVVMERFNGLCLQEVLNTIELSLVHRVLISLDILSALNYCHKNYLIHLDIKPQNIMVQMMYPKPQEKLVTKEPYRSYNCKLCDFGSSIKISKTNPQAKGLAKGTIRYMAPEVLRDGHLTAAADVYAFGILLWQMSYRLMPYHWLESNEVVAYQVVKNKLRPNALQSNKKETIKLSYNFHYKCLCETNPEDLSYYSLETIRNLLNKTKCELIKEKTSSMEYPAKKMVKKRKLLHDLNPNTNFNRQELNVKRDLIQDFMPIDIFALKRVFKNYRAVPSTQQPEQIYEEIFKSCWHNDAGQRPASGRLFRSFKELMKILYCS